MEEKFKYIISKTGCGAETLWYSDSERNFITLEADKVIESLYKDKIINQEEFTKLNKFSCKVFSIGKRIEPLNSEKILLLTVLCSIIKKSEK
jgi:hypothetical protein